MGQVIFRHAKNHPGMLVNTTAHRARGGPNGKDSQFLMNKDLHMSAKPKYAAELAKEVDTSDFIPYSSHVTKDIIKLASGDYIKILRLQGAAHESADIQDINIWHEQLNNFMRNIASPHVAVWSHVVRREYGEYPDGDFLPGFCRQFNEKYKASITGRRMLVNELYLSIVYRPEPVKFNRFIELFGQQEHERREKQLEEIEAINDLGGAALSSLDRYEPELLGCYEHNGFMFSEMLEFLAFSVTPCRDKRHSKHVAAIFWQRRIDVAQRPD
jgi:type IV secretion system protein VirB4